MSQPCGCTSRVGAISFLRCLHLCSDFYQTTDLDSRLSTLAQQNVESRHNNWSQVEQRTITRNYRRCEKSSRVINSALIFFLRPAQGASAELH